MIAPSRCGGGCPKRARTKAEAPKPSPEVEKLGYFLGPWTSEGDLKEGPLGPGGPTQGREVCRWMPGRFFVGCMIETKTPAGLMQIQGIMGWDAEKKVYRWWSFDNLGHSETATGTLKDDVWTWTGESKLGDKVKKTRFVVSDAKPEGYAVRPVELVGRQDVDVDDEREDVEDGPEDGTHARTEADRYAGRTSRTGAGSGADAREVTRRDGSRIRAP